MPRYELLCVDGGRDCVRDLLILARFARVKWTHMRGQTPCAWCSCPMLIFLHGRYYVCIHACCLCGMYTARFQALDVRGIGGGN